MRADGAYADEPVRVQGTGEIDLADMSQYLRAWPDKLVSFVRDHLADDGMEEFVRALYEYICVADRDGPAFERWRNT